MREEFVRCGRAPLSICDKYPWLSVCPTSCFNASAISFCVISRSMPRRVPSTSRKYRNFSPSFILRIAILILQCAICQELDFQRPHTLANFFTAAATLLASRNLCCVPPVEQAERDFGNKLTLAIVCVVEPVHERTNLMRHLLHLVIFSALVTLLGVTAAESAPGETNSSAGSL